MKEQIRNNRMVWILVLLTLIFTIGFSQFGIKEYSRYATDTLHYEKGKVVEISREELEYDKELGIWLGIQELVVEMLEGEEKGEVIEVTNYLTKTHNIYAKRNTALIINADRPEDIEAYYTVYNHDRSLPMLSCILVLAATIIGVGGKKGIKAIAALVYSLFLVVYLLLPMVFSGYSPIWTSILCATLSTAVTLLLLNGQSRKTYAAILATTVGVLCALLLYIAMAALMHMNGFSLSEAEGLTLIQQQTGLQVKEILFAGILIASLGAIMDVGMSIISALYEIHHHSPELDRKELFFSGIEIGRDMIGTMTNTLILAFTGSAFVTLLVFMSYQVQFNQLLNSNYLGLEIAQGVCGTFGIVLTVPAAAAIGAISLKREIL